MFLSLRRVLPDRYPLDGAVERYVADEQRLGRMLDYAVIVPRLQRLYEWSADELAQPHLLELVRDGNPIYVWSFEERHVWRSRQMPFAGRVLARVTRPSTQTARSPPELCRRSCPVRADEFSSRDRSLRSELKPCCSNPIVIGGGSPFLPPVTVPLDLIETRTFGSRVIYERYGRAVRRSRAGP